MERLLTPLLDALTALQSVARRLHPAAIAGLAVEAAEAEEALRAARTDTPDWPERLSPLGAQLDLAAGHAAAALSGLRDAAAAPEGIRLAYGALRHLPKALEALYPIAGFLPPVSRFFLDPAVRDDETLVQSLAGAAPEGTGILAFGPDLDSRQTFWVYVPEYYDPGREWPLVVALHGGRGRGRGFLWSWLSDARSRGAILIAPTSLGGTWALQGDDIDSPHLDRIVALARDKWRIDAGRMLLTGMSDGGTFTYVSGLRARSPFTHLAPFSAAFHPMLGAFADAGRVHGLPVHLIHGALDWMFPADMARMAHEWLLSAGATVTYREIADLSHTYAPDLNGEVLDWMNATAAGG
ncbi:MAG: phospholipase [Rhizobiales bacterium NRL2]|nr:MAG: phospholipase [Rhizobiales bacterium NRL2]